MSATTLCVGVVDVEQGALLLVRRGHEPGAGRWSVPGGRVEKGETLRQAAEREAREETGLELLDLAQFHTYSDPARDPRFHTITTVFSARAEGEPRAGDDAANARVVPLGEISGLSFAFDHGRVLEEWAKARG